MEGRDISQVHILGSMVKEFEVVDKGPGFWKPEILENIVLDGLSYVVDDQGKIGGFLLATYQPVTRKLTWENMYLLKEYRKKGLAEKCFNLSWRLAQERGAFMAEGLVENNNMASQKMLKRLGFEVAGNYLWMLRFSGENR